MSAPYQNLEKTRRRQDGQVPITTSNFLPLPEFDLAGWTPVPQPYPQNIAQPRPYQALPMNSYGFFNKSTESMLADDPFVDAIDNNFNIVTSHESFDASAANYGYQDQYQDQDQDQDQYQYPSPTWGNVSFGDNYGTNIINQRSPPANWNLPPQTFASSPASVPPTPTPAGAFRNVLAATNTNAQAPAVYQPAPAVYQPAPAVYQINPATGNPQRKWKCTKCKSSYVTKPALERHMDKHNGVSYRCGIAGCMQQPVMRKDSVKRHSANKHPGQEIIIIKLWPVAENDEDNDEE